MIMNVSTVQPLALERAILCFNILHVNKMFYKKLFDFV